LGTSEDEEEDDDEEEEEDDDDGLGAFFLRSEAFPARMAAMIPDIGSSPSPSPILAPMLARDFVSCFLGLWIKGLNVRTEDQNKDQEIKRSRDQEIKRSRD